MERGMSRGKKHHIYGKKDICDGEGQVLLRDIRVMERGQSFTKRDD